MVKPYTLEDWIQFLRIRQLVRAGVDTQEEIAEALGLYCEHGKRNGQPNRAIIQTRVNLARLPRFVQAEFEKLCCEGKDVTPIRWVDISKLFRAYNAEYAEYPLGNGPEFLWVWQAIFDPARVK